jgi:hypothetical protein
MRYWDGGGELGIAFLASFVWVTRSEEELNGQKPLLDNSFIKRPSLPAMLRSTIYAGSLINFPVRVTPHGWYLKSLTLLRRSPKS